MDRPVVPLSGVVLEIDENGHRAVFLFDATNRRFSCNFRADGTPLAPIEWRNATPYHTSRRAGAAGSWSGRARFGPRRQSSPARFSSGVRGSATNITA